MKFHDIGFAAQAEPTGAQQKPRGDFDGAAFFTGPTVGFFMQQSPFGGVLVFRPDLLQMDQRTLPGAIEVMLQSRKRDEIGFGVHATLTV
jgi:hypothetical protein